MKNRKIPTCQKHLDEKKPKQMIFSYFTDKSRICSFKKLRGRKNVEICFPNIKANNHRGSGQLLRGCQQPGARLLPPNARTHCVWSIGRREEQIQWAMLRSQDAGCLPATLMYIICHVGTQENNFCFNRCLKTVLKQRWPDVKIKWFLNRIFCVLSSVG